MGCVELLKGFDISCEPLFRKYYQNVILINKDYVDEYRISSNNSEHRIQFNLKQGKSGRLFMANENSSLLSAEFSKTEKKGISEYEHTVDIVVAGTSENVKTLLKQLDNSNFFAAIQFRNGDVEIHGFENGLQSEDYSYQAQSSLGGANISLSSKFPEYDVPYLYYSNNINQDFNNLFANLPTFLSGDFNNDFSNDFYIE